MRVLFVCLGNICRSPTAEAVFRDKASDHDCDSAGTGGWHIGKPPYPQMQDAAKASGYDLSSMRARQFEVSDFDNFDLIIAMDPQNLSDIEAQRPALSETPVKLMMSFARNCGTNAVPDPYFTGDFDGALQIIETAIDGLIDALAHKG